MIGRKQKQHDLAVYCHICTCNIQHILDFHPYMPTLATEKHLYPSIDPYPTITPPKNA